jgi:hypothetical protein
MRRWYSGATMAGGLKGSYHVLSHVMDLSPSDAKNVFRGFKVDSDSSLLTGLHEGDRISLDVTRNGGVSSWTTHEAAANKFSGGGNGKVGIVVQLASTQGIRPILAPPDKTEKWFNQLYNYIIGSSWRPTEQRVTHSGVALGSIPSTCSK